MMKNKFKKYVSSYVLLSDDEFNLFYNLFEMEVVHKKEYLFENGERIHAEVFVTKGIFKIYNIDENGKEHILYFADENSWISELSSSAIKLHPNRYVQSLEENIILTLSEENKNIALKSIPKLNQFFKEINENSYAIILERLIEILTYNAEIRYKKFVKENPVKAQRLTNIQIAAYLGISHEFISKIRKK